MIVIWTPEAEQDRADIWDYIVADNPGAAVHMDELFSGAAERLAAHPKMGKAGRVPGTRELIPHENYCRSTDTRCGCWLWCILPDNGHKFGNNSGSLVVRSHCSITLTLHNKFRILSCQSSKIENYFFIYPLALNGACGFG